MAERRLLKIWGHLQPNATAAITSVEEIPPNIQVDVAALRNLLDEDKLELKNAIREYLEKENSFELNAELGYHERREQVFKWAKKIASQGFISVKDIKADPAKIIAFFEVLGFFDHSTVTKLATQFNSFGGTIMHLGSQRHEHLYPLIDNFDLVGTVGLTELGHGSSGTGIDTTATYDESTKEFVIQTPSWPAQKFWISSVVVHGTVAVIFANLVVSNEEKGVHAFVVPIRDENGKVLPGISIRDLGKKGGQRGVDSGAISFNEVRVPKANLLNRWSDVNDDGIFSSKFPTQRKLFSASMSGFILGRLIAAAACISGMKVAVTIAVRYAHIRKDFGPTEDGDVEIISFTTHQRKLMPIVARSFALDFFNKFLTEQMIQLNPEKEQAELHSTVSGFKAMTSWHAIKDIQTCRECCGTQGYRSSWRIPGLRDDIDMWATAEGDNTVMMQQVVKFLLPEYEKQKNRGTFSGILAHMVKRNYKTLHGNNINNIWLKAAFEIREAELLRELSKKMLVLKNEGVEYFDAWNQNLPLIVRLGQAYIDRRVFIHFYTLLAELPSDLQEPLSLLCNLDGMFRVADDLGWFVAHGVMSAENAKYYDEQLTFLCGKAAEISLPLTDSFGIPARCLPKDINIYEKSSQ